jgi:hypothetical protein
MNVTVTHRPHAPLPWLSIVLVLAIAAAAVLAAALIVAAAGTDEVAIGTQYLGTAGTSASSLDVSRNESAVVRSFIAGDTTGGASVAAPPESPTAQGKYCRAPWWAAH